MLVSRSLEEHFQNQLQAHRNRSINQFGMPIAFIFKRQERVDFDFFAKAIKLFGGHVSEFMNHPIKDIVKISYQDRNTEIWVHPGKDDYLDLYNDFCETELNVKIKGSYKKEGFAVDHSYNKAAIPDGTDAYIRLFLVRSSPNSSWGGYFERYLKDYL